MGLVSTLEDRTTGFIVGSATLQVCLVLFAVVLAALGSAALGDRLGLRRGRLTPLQTGVAAIGFIALSIAVHAILELTALKSESALAEIEGQVVGQRGPALTWLLLTIGVAPAIGEELLFRGAVLRGLLPHLHAAAAIALSAVLFGLVHLEPIHVTAAVPLGLYLGVLGWVAQSVWAPMVAHALNNTVAVLGPAFAVAASAGPGDPSRHGWIAALGTGVAIATLIWLVRRAGPPPRPPVPTADAPSALPPLPAHTDGERPDEDLG